MAIKVFIFFSSFHKFYTLCYISVYDKATGEFGLCRNIPRIICSTKGQNFSAAERLPRFDRRGYSVIPDCPDKDGDAVLDVGSGTGAVALCLAERFKTLRPGITGLELQAELAELSNMSAAANGSTGF